MPERIQDVNHGRIPSVASRIRGEYTEARRVFEARYMDYVIAEGPFGAPPIKVQMLGRGSIDFRRPASHK